MPTSILPLLASFASIHLTEAYTGRSLGSISTDNAGVVLSANLRGQTINLAKVAEVRFRANENPELFYETDYSAKFLAASKSQTTGQLPCTPAN